MTTHPRDRKLLLQHPDEGPHGVLLLLGAGVGRMAPLVQAALVGDTDAFPVVTAGMGSCLFQRTGAVDVTVLADVEVIADTPHTLGQVAAEQVGLREVDVRTGGGAMYHYQGYPTHAVTPNAPANAEATAMMIRKMISHVFFFCCSMIE